MKQYTENFIRIPLSIFFRGRKYTGEVSGQGHSFTCSIPGTELLVIESAGRKPSGGYLWVARRAHELGSYVGYIGRQIEKHLLNNKANKYP